MPNSFRYQEPIIDVSPVILGKPVVIEYPLAKTLVMTVLGLTVTGSATGAATKTIPRPSWGAGVLSTRVGMVCDWVRLDQPPLRSLHPRGDGLVVRCVARLIRKQRALRGRRRSRVIDECS